MELIIEAPCNDKKSLEKVENGYIQEYAEKFGNKLLNIKCNPLKKVKKVEYQVKIETKDELMKRIEKLEKKLIIKDDEIHSRLFFDAIINGKRQHMEARYIRCSKEEAMTKINQKKQEKINELTIYFE